MESNKGSPSKISSKDEDGICKEGKLASENVPVDLQNGDLKVGVDEEGVDPVSNKDVEGEKITTSSPVKPWDTPGYCRKCHMRLTFEEDGRGGMWYGRDGSVWTDGTGLCIDCELDGSVETGMTRSSDEEDSSSSEGVSSATPSKKRKQ